MKHAPLGREESKNSQGLGPEKPRQNSQGWDPRTHEEKSIANSRRISTLSDWYRRGHEANQCDQAARRMGADVPGDATTAQGQERDGAYLEPVTCLR